jgi:Ni,Fe-hydrogenase III small subunit
VSQPGPAAPDGELAGSIAARLDVESAARLGRSLAVFPVMAGECGGCALELAALRGAAYGLARHGVSVVDHPAQADVLLVAGALTRALLAPVQLAYAAMGTPRFVLGIGDCALDGGPFRAAGPVAGGLDAAVPVDLVVPGCPPTPAAMLSALLTVLLANEG